MLTPDFVYVMGTKSGENFRRFQDYCVRAYLILRRNSSMFINLFAMMLSTGIPELKATEDIYYLRDALCLDKSEAVRPATRTVCRPAPAPSPPSWCQGH